MRDGKAFVATASILEEDGHVTSLGKLGACANANCAMHFAILSATAFAQNNEMPVPPIRLSASHDPRISRCAVCNTAARTVCTPVRWRGSRPRTSPRRQLEEGSRFASYPSAQPVLIVQVHDPADTGIMANGLLPGGAASTACLYQRGVRS